MYLYVSTATSTSSALTPGWSTCRLKKRDRLQSTKLFMMTLWHLPKTSWHLDVLTTKLALLFFFFVFFYLPYSVSSIGLFCLHCFSNKQKERWLQPSVHSNTVMRAWSCKSHLWVRTSIKVSSLLLPFHCFSLVHKYDNSGYKPGLFGVKTFCLRWWKSGFDFNRELSLIN